MSEADCLNHQRNLCKMVIFHLIGKYTVKHHSRKQSAVANKYYMS